MLMLEERMLPQTPKAPELFMTTASLIPFLFRKIINGGTNCFRKPVGEPFPRAENISW